MPTQDRKPRPTPPSNRQRPTRQTQTSQATGGPLSRASRTQVIFIIVSSLVVCSLILAGVVAIATDRFSNTADVTQQPYTDPNKDMIGEQQTKVAEHPDDYYALTLLANLLGNTGRLSEAIPLYEKALQMRPDDQGVRLDFARALADGGHRSDAEIQFKKVIAEAPDNQQAHYYLAEMYRVSAPPRTVEAITEYRIVIQLDASTYMAQQAAEQLKILGVSASPVASPSSGTPAVASTPQS
ncbi:MAG: tetratricopeptide repeat protein [Thermomicrobiales bacterium]